MLGLFDWLKFGAGLAAGAVLMTLWAQFLLVPRAHQEGREAERSAALQRSIELIQERSRTNEAVGNLDRAALCRELGGRMQPDGRCE